MDELPTEVLEVVLCYCNLPCLTVLASTSHTLRWTLSSGDCKKLCWAAANAGSRFHFVVPTAARNVLRNDVDGEIAYSYERYQEKMAVEKKYPPTIRCDTVSVAAALLESPNEDSCTSTASSYYGTPCASWDRMSIPPNAYYRYYRSEGTITRRVFPWSPFRTTQHDMWRRLSNVGYSSSETQGRAQNMAARIECYAWLDLYRSVLEKEEEEELRREEESASNSSGDGESSGSCCSHDDSGNKHFVTYPDAHSSTTASSSSPNTKSSSHDLLLLHIERCCGTPLQAMRLWAKIMALHCSGAADLAYHAIEQFPFERLSYISRKKTQQHPPPPPPPPPSSSATDKKTIIGIIPFSSALAAKMLMPPTPAEVAALRSAWRLKTLDSEDLLDADDDDNAARIDFLEERIVAVTTTSTADSDDADGVVVRLLTHPRGDVLPFNNVIVAPGVRRFFRAHTTKESNAPTKVEPTLRHYAKGMRRHHRSNVNNTRKNDSAKSSLQRQRLARQFENTDDVASGGKKGTVRRDGTIVGTTKRETVPWWYR